MKFSLISFLLVFNLNIFASSNEVLKCFITEPFITYIFSPDTKTLTMKTPYEETILSESASFISVANINSDGELGSKYKVIDLKTSKVFINLVLDKNGSDGMSNFSYPYSAKIGSFHAGCSSTSAPAVNTYNSVYNLKSN